MYYLLIAAEKPLIILIRADLKLSASGDMRALVLIKPVFAFSLVGVDLRDSE